MTTLVIDTAITYLSSSKYVFDELFFTKMPACMLPISFLAMEPGIALCQLACCKSCFWYLSYNIRSLWRTQRWRIQLQRVSAFNAAVFQMAFNNSSKLIKALCSESAIFRRLEGIFAVFELCLPLLGPLLLPEQGNKNFLRRKRRCNRSVVHYFEKRRNRNSPCFILSRRSRSLKRNRGAAGPRNKNCLPRHCNSYD